MEIYRGKELLTTASSIEGNWIAKCQKGMGVLVFTVSLFFPHPLHFVPCLDINFSKINMF